MDQAKEEIVHAEARWIGVPKWKRDMIEKKEAAESRTKNFGLMDAIHAHREKNTTVAGPSTAPAHPGVSNTSAQA